MRKKCELETRKSYLFLTDIDGTLLKGNSDIPVKVIAAAKKFTDAGGLLGLSTGRILGSVIKIAEQLKINCASCLLNGAVIYDFSAKKFLDIVRFGYEVKELLCELVSFHPGMSVQAYSTEKIYDLRITPFLSRFGLKEEVSDRITKPDEISDDILKIVLSCDDIKILEKCRKALFTSDKQHFAFSSIHFCEIVPKGADKGSALEKIADLYDIELCNTFTAGDAYTDLSMLKMSGYAFIPEDAPEELQKLGFVIPGYLDGGMEKAFEFAYDLIEY